MKGGAARPCTSAWLGEDDWIAESAIGQKYAYSMKPSAVLEHTTILSSALRAHEGHCHRGGLHNEERPRPAAIKNVFTLYLYMRAKTNFFYCSSNIFLGSRSHYRNFWTPIIELKKSYWKQRHHMLHPTAETFQFASSSSVCTFKSQCEKVADTST